MYFVGVVWGVMEIGFGEGEVGVGYYLGLEVEVVGVVCVGFY